MKTLSVAVAVAAALAFSCIQESSAAPLTGMQEQEEAMSNDDPVAERQEVSVDSSKMANNRPKRESPCCDCPYFYCEACCMITMLRDIVESISGSEPEPEPDCS
ncbi:hepcidin-like isoform X1 [Scomber scombrus]|uniref:hepcidin-like isoform X1 n=1 Tax=Scomber scombrus TaxID=13677 RepID=UPI002DDBF1E7|nr:hepcidin-like isoform X1 [Scomber scombrus]